MYASPYLFVLLSPIATEFAVYTRSRNIFLHSKQRYTSESSNAAAPDCLAHTNIMLLATRACSLKPNP